MYQVGDSVHYFLESGGQQTGIVGFVGEDHLRVLDSIGGSVRLAYREAVEVHDGRMSRLRDLDSESPKEAAQERAEYLSAWKARAAQASSELEQGSPNKARKGVKALENDGVAESVIKVIVEAGSPLSKSDIAKVLGGVPDRWNEVIETVLKSGKVSRTGKKRGTKYGKKGI